MPSLRPAPLTGLAGRVFVGTAAIVVCVVAAALVAASATVRRAGDAAARRGLEQSADLVAQFLAGRQRSLAGGARVFAQGPYFRSLVAAQRRDDVLDQALEAAEQLEADWVFITDAEGRLLAKSDEPSASGAALGGVPLVAGALRGQLTTGYGVSRDSLLFQVVAVPIAVPGAPPVGALVATRVVDSALAHAVQTATAGEVVFYALAADGTPRLAASSLGRGAGVRAALPALAARAGRRAPVAIDGVTYLAQGSGATTAGGETVGGFAVLRGRDAERAELAGVQRSLLAAGLVGLALALGAAWVAARRVTRPMRALAEAARRAGEGDFRADEVLRVAGEAGDEIAALGTAFGAMLADLRDQAALDAARLVPPGAPEPPGRELALHRASRGPAPTAGDVLAERWVLEERIGAGGTGVVWRARDLALGELVALKVLRPELVADPDALERFKEELRLARRLGHRNVVRLHDFGQDVGRDGGVAFLTMELVRGASLAGLLATRGALPPAAVLSVAKQLARALDAAHAEGVVHGDLKPANVLVCTGGVLKVTDFGLARLVHGPQAPDGGPRIAGAAVGTPAYMAPELLVGAAPSPATDLYAAGMVLQACLTGETPFDEDTPVAFFARKLDEVTGEHARPAALAVGAPGRVVAAAPRSAPAADASVAPLRDAIARLTATDPRARPADARAMYALFAGIG